MYRMILRKSWVLAGNKWSNKSDVRLNEDVLCWWQPDSDWNKWWIAVTPKMILPLPTIIQYKSILKKLYLRSHNNK